jgi:hypothetical protein
MWPLTERLMSKPRNVEFDNSRRYLQVTGANKVTNDNIMGRNECGSVSNRDTAKWSTGMVCLN